MLRYIFSLFILLITGCSKSNHIESNRKELLTAHPWKIKALLYRMKNDAVNSNLTQYVYKPCELDDVYTFGEDSTFKRDDNILNCTIPFYFGPFGAGNWMGNNDLSQLVISKPGYYSIIFTVDDITANMLIIEQATKDRFENNIVYTYEFEPAQ